MRTESDAWVPDTRVCFNPAHARGRFRIVLQHARVALQRKVFAPRVHVALASALLPAKDAELHGFPFARHARAAVARLRSVLD